MWEAAALSRHHTADGWRLSGPCGISDFQSNGCNKMVLEVEMNGGEGARVPRQYEGKGSNEMGLPEKGGIRDC